MQKFLASLVAVAAVGLFAGESQAQHFYRGYAPRTGVSIGFNSGFNNFGYGRGFRTSGISINIGNGGFGGYPVNRGFYGGVPYYVARPVVPVYRAPVYRGGFYGGGYYGGGFRRGCGW